MTEWKKAIISPDVSILKAMRVIDREALQIALVVDKNGKLLGTITDGDIRRGILNGINLEEPVQEIMYKKFTFARENDDPKKIELLMKKETLHHIPILDHKGRLVGLQTIDNLFNSTEISNIVLLMAGGSGSRLYPLTENCPKPLLHIGGKPILESILESFIEQGFSRFYFSINYKADMVKEYFGNGSRWGVNINYLHEKKKLGTAGALTLLGEQTDEPILVMNGDILTKVDFRKLLDFHREQLAEATMCVREYTMQVPYGVVDMNNNHLSRIEEKPIQRFFVNAGIYVLNPGILDYIPANQYFDMPELFKNLIEAEKETAAFPIREYWIDIGRKDDFDKANGEFTEVFG